jgi:hypothetical protein
MAKATFTHGLTDGYLGGDDQSVMENSFNAGMEANQKTMQGSKMDGERQSMKTSAGLNQPVVNGTKNREEPAM